MTVIQLRRGTAAEWTSRNPVLAAGEVGLETDTAKIKAGNGTATWNNLPYIFGSSGTGASTVGHGAVSSTVRPAWYGSVIWIGSVQPVNSINGDIWIDTSGTVPVIATTVLDSLNVGVTTSQFPVSSGTTPLIWSYTGTLPPGLALSTAGNLFGVPTTTGSYSFTVSAQNPFGVSTKTYSGSVGAALAPTITTASLNTISQGVPFSQTLTATGSATITWSYSALPAGLSLNSATGVLSGSASETSYNFTVTATNSAGSNSKTFSGSIVGTPPTITTTALNALYRGVSFTQALDKTGSTPVSFAVQTGSLPTGLPSTIPSTGIITGTPTAVGIFSASVQITNAYGSSTQTIGAVVAESTPALTQSSLNSMTVGTAFSQTLTATGYPPLSFSVQSGSGLNVLPPGLSLNGSTGAISGTPTAAGSYTPTIRVTNGASATADRQITAPVLDNSVTFDAASSPQPFAVQSPSFGFTAAAGTDVFVAISTAFIYGTTAISAITYNNSAMSLVNRTNHAGLSDASEHGVTYLYRAAAAGTGGSAQVSVTFNAGLTSVIGAVSYKNVKTLGAVVTTSGVGTAPSTGSITCSTSGVILGVIGGGRDVAGAASITSSSGGTSRISGVSTGNYVNLIVRDDSSTKSFSAVLSSADQWWSCIGVPLNP